MLRASCCERMSTNGARSSIMVLGRRRKWTCWQRKPQICWPETVWRSRTTHEPQARRRREGRFPHASGGRGKKRPVVVVQADVHNQRLRHAVMSQVTTNLDEKGDPACLFV